MKTCLVYPNSFLLGRLFNIYIFQKLLIYFLIKSTLREKMASNNYYTNFPLILILVMSLTLSQFSFSSLANPAIVYLIDDISINLDQVITIICKTRGGFDVADVVLVHQSHDYVIVASISNAIYVCHAKWKNLSASFNAYDPIKEDKGHPDVYWSLQDEGIKKSWNKHKWILVTKWS